MIYFLIPVFNEELNIPSLRAELVKAASGREACYVFSDDGSTDNTVETLNHLFAGTRFAVLGDGINRGPGAAFNRGFEWILEHAGEEDLVVTMEGDNTSSLEILDKMLVISGTGFDLVLASVYAQGGGFEKTSFLRKLTSLGANLVLRFAFDIKVLTLSSFYRVYKVSLLRRVKQQYTHIITEPGFICMIELLLKAVRVEASVIEVPMKLYSTRRKGKSKMKVMKTSLSYLRFLLKNINRY
jgi:dolichol-phosphate mannosyltransferase